ncbi:hypothetical protein TNCV_4358041 [Trichonephila clavipes]|nr:hypothetical protein TNCV_4358041 [Trichonephila clavipes]
MYFTGDDKDELDARCGISSGGKRCIVSQIQELLQGKKPILFVAKVFHKENEALFTPQEFDLDRGKDHSLRLFQLMDGKEATVVTSSGFVLLQRDEGPELASNNPKFPPCQREDFEQRETEPVLQLL